MFQNWGFLLGEIWVLLALAALVGMVAGWLIRGRTAATVTPGSNAEAERLRLDLGDCEARSQAQGARIAGLEHELQQFASRAAALAAPAPAVALPEGVRRQMPQGLKAPRDGKPDDLRLIKGVGPRLQSLLNSLGYYHFDQIAAWTPAEIAWVDENLEGFRGRMIREEWVEQARALAAGAAPRPGGEN